ncbi:MAG: hypothetical protein C0406_08925 [Sideroxydans sp.]|nr:hypothetical protein [Sideroxydans sp.]
MSKNMLIKSVPVLLAGLILTGCGGPAPLAKPTPEAFNFEQIAKDPSKETKQNLNVEVFGDGIKNTKKFVIGAFQVRVRTDLTGEFKSARSLGFTGFEKMESHNMLGTGNDALFQKATDALYKEFVANLKQRGFEVVNLSSIKKHPEYQQTGSNATTEGQMSLKGEFASGHSVPLVAESISDDQEGDNGTEYGTTAVEGLFSEVPDDNYQIFYPAAVPGLNYSRNIITMFKPTDYPMGDDIVLRSQLPRSLLEAAARDKAGIITVAFELELIKIRRELTDGTDRTTWRMSKAPMLRTKLSTLKMLPPGTKMGSFFNAMNFTEGLRITTKHRGVKHTGMKAMFDGEFFSRHWVEVDDGSVTLTQKDEYEPGILNPVPAKFPAAFKKATDGNLQMIMYAIDHQSDF